MITILIVPIVLCFVVVAILPVHEADAKECNSDKNDVIKTTTRLILIVQLAFISKTQTIVINLLP
jgi:hypothetical protein